MSLRLPNNPGLSRRNAYGEYIRQKNRNIGRNNSFSVVNYSRYYDLVVNNLFTNTIRQINASGQINNSDQINNAYENAISYERLVELPNVLIGLDVKELTNNSKVELSYDKDFCVVCQESIQKYNIIRKLKCNHNYHINCIENWLKDHCTCPLCKQNLKNIK